MKPDMQRRLLFHSGLAMGAAVWVPAARACEFFSANLRVFHPWTRASAVHADTALVSMKFDEVIQADRLLGAETPVAAAAELLGPDVQAGAPMDLFIPAGQETLLSETGTCLRLVGLHFALQVGREYPLKLTFEKGGMVQARLSVDYARFF